MKPSILEALARDNLRPGESRSFQSGSAYHKALEHVVKSENELRAALSENTPLFDAFSRVQDELDSFTQTEKFISGFRLGMLMAVEVFTMPDDLIFGGEA